MSPSGLGASSQPAAFQPRTRRHTDMLGSVRAITDETGAVVIRHDYRPFGEDTQPLTGDPNRFAGKQLDAETAQHYFDARYYRNTWGRFTTVDPLHVGAAMTDPQQWNRYAYARNNPLRFTDPSGLCVNQTIDGHTYCVSEAVQVTADSGYSGFAGLASFGDQVCEIWFHNGNIYGYVHCTSSERQIHEVAVTINGTARTGSSSPTQSAALDKLQAALDVVSIGLDATGAGAVASPVVDIVNGITSAIRGNWADAGLSAWAAVPWLGVSGNLARLTKQAADLYPRKALKADELHHVMPKYLGGPPNGPTVPLNPAYHQMITNEFRRLHPYGNGPLSPAEQQRLADEVYSRFPLP